METYQNRCWCVSSAPLNKKCINLSCDRYFKDEDIEKSKNKVVAWGDFHSVGLKCPRFIKINLETVE